MGAIGARQAEAIPRYRLGFLLQQSHREWYQLIAQKITGSGAASGATRRSSRSIEFADRLDPEHIAARLMTLGDACDAMSGDQPRIIRSIGQTIQALKALGASR